MQQWPVTLWHFLPPPQSPGLPCSISVPHVMAGVRFQSHLLGLSRAPLGPLSGPGEPLACHLPCGSSLDVYVSGSWGAPFFLLISTMCIFRGTCTWHFAALGERHPPGPAWSPGCQQPSLWRLQFHRLSLRAVALVTAQSSHCLQVKWFTHSKTIASLHRHIHACPRVRSGPERHTSNPSWWSSLGTDGGKGDSWW